MNRFFQTAVATLALAASAQATTLFTPALSPGVDRLHECRFFNASTRTVHVQIQRISIDDGAVLGEHSLDLPANEGITFDGFGAGDPVICKFITNGSRSGARASAVIKDNGGLGDVVAVPAQ